jgi:hypothetical protein
MLGTASEMAARSVDITLQQSTQREPQVLLALCPIYSYEDALNDIAFDNTSGQRAI